MDILLDYLKVFITGGTICMIGQILIDKTKLTPARILVLFVTLGVILTGLGIYEYIVDIVNATRTSEWLELGISPRGTVALINMSRAVAFLAGRNYVIPEDVQSIFLSVASHRVLLSSKAKISKKDVKDILTDIIRSITIARV